MSEIQHATQAGMEHHQAGRLAEAERAYRQVLQLDPNNAVALHLLGIVAHQSGDNALSLQLIDQAVAAKADFALAFNSRGNVMQVLGRFEEALASYDRAVAIRPDYAEAWCQRGNVLKVLGRCEEALGSCDRALALRPGLADALNIRGNALQELGRSEEAVACYDQALASEPGIASALNNRASALVKLKRYDEALASCDRALSIRPRYGEALSNRGNALVELRRLDEAVSSYDAALAIRHDIAEVWNDRGNALNELKRYAEAFASLDKALALKPHYAEALHNRGNALTGLERHEEAIASYDRALAIEPGFPEALSNRGNVLFEHKRIDEAAASWHSALKIRPDYVEAHAGWIQARQHLCDWAGLEKEAGALRVRVTQDRSGKVLPGPFLSLHCVQASEQLLCARQYAEEVYGDLLSRPPLCGEPRQHAGARKLRIGYLSSDFREHPVSYLLAEVIELHDRGKFEIFGYSCGPDDTSPMRQRMRAAFDTFLDVAPLSDALAAKRILDDRIDILVQLNGYTQHNRLPIVALRPAPLQVNWLGYPGTLGHPRLADYLIGDAMVTPLEHAAHYSESLALMPHCYLPNDRQRRIGEIPSRTEAGLPAQGFVFCCFNQAYKISPLAFDLWCRLLAAVPGSLLWLQEPIATAQANLRREAVARGIAAERLIFAPMRPRVSDHLARIQLADLALDTHPYTSHSTGCDALWAGTPLVTMAGDSFVSRAAASILDAAGLPHLVARDAESYFQLALELARQPDRLRDIREDLRSRRMSCSLFDSKGFTRNLERLYRKMWADHGAGIKAHIQLEDAAEG